MAVYAHTRMIPIKTANQTQPVHANVLRPLKRLTTMTAETTIVFQDRNVSTGRISRCGHTAYRGHFVLISVPTVVPRRHHVVRVVDEEVNHGRLRVAKSSESKLIMDILISKTAHLENSLEHVD